MSALLALGAIACAASSGLGGLFFKAGDGRGEKLAVEWLSAAALLGFSAAGTTWALGPGELDLPWAVPGARLLWRVDALSAFFLVPIFGIGLLGAIYGLEYWPEVTHPESGRRLRLCYGLVVAGLATVVCAGNAILFLAGWEVMALAAFVAIGTEDHLEEPRRASYLYLVLTRAGTLSLFAMFALMHASTGSFTLGPLTGVSGGRLTAIFALGAFGFGIKAGVMPLHVWLPGAHAATPSHMSALMSGVLIKIGIYGLLRLLSLVPSPPLWWAHALIFFGAVSGVLGVALALGQHDVKRLLAYHSIENIGIIVIGVGLAVLGRSANRPELVALGLGGALLHVWNHGLFKALLFLSAGAVVHSCGTRGIDRLGGLMRQMPRAAAFFAVGAVAICGLPPLNGFVSELFIYLGLFEAARLASGLHWVPAALAGPVLALIGALALACFVKVFGAVFLGQARSPDAAKAHDGGWKMTGPMAALAAACAFIALAPPVVAPALDAAVRAFSPSTPQVSLRALAPLSTVGWMQAMVVVTSSALGLALYRTLAKSPTATAVTWDCGYAAPAPRMQYTASSFADFLVGLFAWALRPVAHPAQVKGLFPQSTRFTSHVPDAVLDDALVPAVDRVVRAFGWFKWLQPGAISLYVLYILVALVLALIWMNGAL